MSRCLPLFVLLLATNVAAAGDDLAAARVRIAPQAIAAHMRFLASDLLEGRESGSRGFDIGAQYVAAQFEAVGLTPVTPDWLQPVPMRSAMVDEAQSSFAIDGVALAARKDYLLRPDWLREANGVDGASVVFAGFGVVAPELGRDDYAGIDARGKVVLLLTGAPSSFPTDQRAYYSSGDTKAAEAAKHGAVGTITLRSMTDEVRYPFARQAEQTAAASMRALDAAGRPFDVLEPIRVAASISRAAAARLFAGAPVTIDEVLQNAEQGKTTSMALAPKVSMHVASRFADARSANVVGMLRGSDPKLRDEYVVLSAHLDHLGNHAHASGDPIYNGAFDNASGIACIIEIARAFAALPVKPRRSLLFVAVTGEEKGEQGSLAFARTPPVRGTLVADINIDMFLMLFPMKDLVAFGAEHSTLGALGDRAAQANGFTISPDPTPEEVRFIRSDQYSFVRQGIPAIILKAGEQSADPKIDGRTVTRNWLRTIYHSPKDDMAQTIDFASGARYAQTNFLLAWYAANGDAKPTWTSGDFFGALFANHGAP